MDSAFDRALGNTGTVDPNRVKGDHQLSDAAKSNREAAAKYAKKRSSAERDIGDIPAVVNWDRREQAEQSLSFYMQTYHPTLYTRPFSDVHYAVINRLEAAIKHGGLRSYAMPRGTGKTTMAESATEWAMLSAHRRYIVLISSTIPNAIQSLENIKIELATNELLLEDWPEIIYPIWSLEGSASRATGQMYKGVSTHITWKGNQLVMPTIPDSAASGSVVEVRGITSSIRGMKANLPGGRGSIRPELVVLDDPQTDESAKSPTQCADRSKIIRGTILGLAGHETPISAVMPCTIIHKGDLAETFLDNEKEPEWQGVRAGILKSMPTNSKLWEKYADLKREDQNGDTAQNFYIEHRTAMDEGAVPMWEECYNKGDISAIQYAMNLKIRVGEEAFWAEYMNNPIDSLADGEVVTMEQVMEKTTGYRRWQIPPNVTHLTGYVDVHKNVLFYMICGWDGDFNGYIIQYGVWPESDRKYLTQRDISDTLQKKYPGMGTDGAIYAGLRDCTNKMLTKEWGLSGLHVGRIVVDANWRTKTVKAFCRESERVAQLTPGHGRFVGPGQRPLDEYTKASGDMVGHYWRIPAVPSRGGIRHLIYDINYWKSFVNTGLIAPPGERGCIQLFGNFDHKCIAEHFTSEYPVETSARGRTVNEWKLRPGRDNHWWDCLVGNAVAASMLGSSPINKVKYRSRRRVRLLKT